MKSAKITEGTMSRFNLSVRSAVVFVPHFEDAACDRTELRYFVEAYDTDTQKIYRHNSASISRDVAEGWLASMESRRQDDPQWAPVNDCWTFNRLCYGSEERAAEEHLEAAREKEDDEMGFGFSPFLGA